MYCAARLPYGVATSDGVITGGLILCNACIKEVFTLMLIYYLLEY